MSYEKKWWSDRVGKGYFTDKQFFHSYKNMAFFELQNKKILEIGFGYGRELSQFCKLSPYVYGCDISDHAPEMCIKTLQELKDVLFMPTLKTYDGINIPFDMEFDFIYSCFVLQHMSKANVILLIKNALSKLSTKGRILFEFYGNLDFYHPTDDVYSGTPETGMYNNAYKPEDIKKTIDNAGGKMQFIHDWLISEKEGIKTYNYWACISK